MVKKEEKLKKCSDCKIFKNTKDFYNSSITFDGFNYLCKDCCKNASRLNKIKIKTLDFRRYWSQTTIWNHKKEGYTVTFKWDELLAFVRDINVCGLCGCDLVWGETSKERERDRASLDRVNNEHEITLDNIMIVCMRCNAAKTDRNLNDYYRHCEVVINRKHRQDAKVENYIDDGF